MARTKRPTRAEARERDLRAALSWPEDAPAPLTQDECLALVGGQFGKTVVRAWTYNVARGDVTLGAFAYAVHRSDGPLDTPLARSQGWGGPWFLSRDAALAALRMAATREAAERLHALDARIGNMRAAALPDAAPDAT